MVFSVFNAVKAFVFFALVGFFISYINSKREIKISVYKYSTIDLINEKGLSSISRLR